MNLSIQEEERNEKWDFITEKELRDTKYKKDHQN